MADECDKRDMVISNLKQKLASISGNNHFDVDEKLVPAELYKTETKKLERVVNERDNYIESLQLDIEEIQKQLRNAEKLANPVENDSASMQQCVAHDRHRNKIHIKCLGNQHPIHSRCNHC